MYINSNAAAVNNMPCYVNTYYNFSSGSEINQGYIVRSILRQLIYNNPLYKEELKNMIGEKISCFHLDFDEDEYCYAAKVKKSSVKKMPKYEHSSSFYINSLQSIFHSFVSNHEREIVESISRTYNMDQISSYQQFKSVFPQYIGLLFTVSCTGNGFIKIYI